MLPPWGVLQQLGIPMDRLHWYLGHGDAFHAWSVSVVERLKVELGRCVNCYELAACRL